jgi:hypothetical protein
VVSILFWLWWVIDLHRFEFESGKFRWFYSIILSIRVENCVFLSHGVQMTVTAWWTATWIVTGVRDLVQMIGDDQAQVGYSVPEWLGGRVTLCVVCTVRKETMSACFLIWPQNQGQRFISGLTSKPLRRVFRFGHKTGSYSLMIWASKSSLRFLSLCLKTKRATVYRLRHKTDGRIKMTRDTCRDLATCFGWK